MGSSSLSPPLPRCYSFGIGPNVCHRLVKGLATVSKGSAEFLREGERLQPKVGGRAPALCCWTLTLTHGEMRPRKANQLAQDHYLVHVFDTDFLGALD